MQEKYRQFSKNKAWSGGEFENISIPFWEISLSATNLKIENLTKCKAPNIFIAQHLFKSGEKWKKKFFGFMDLNKR